MNLHPPKPEKSWLLAIVATAIAGCTTTIIVDPYYRPPNAQVDSAFVSPSADFGNYSRLMARPLEIYYPDNAPAPTQEDVDRMRQIFRDAFLAELGDDYEIVDAPGPDVMLVAAQVIDLKVLGPQGTYVPTGRLRDVVTRGQLTLLMEFQDSETGRVLARAGEADEGNTTSVTNEAESWRQVEAAATRWAGMFKTFLDTNLGQG